MASSKAIVEEAFHEVHAKTPSTVPAWKKGRARERMMVAIALSKARKKGAKV
jgi:hypothetical protein